MLEETGLPYETRVLDCGSSMKSAEYRAINPMGPWAHGPMGKVPAIQHGEQVVTENSAICLDLADQVPEKKPAPAVGAPERAAYYCSIAFLSPLEPLMLFKATQVKMPGPAMAGFGSAADVLDTLDRALSAHDHLAGDDFTACAPLMAAYLGWSLQSGLLEPRPAFVQCVQRHSQRPADHARTLALQNATPQ